MSRFRKKGIVALVLLFICTVLFGATLAMADPTNALPPPPIPIPIPAPPD